ncbi:MAG: hypothetical protein V7609_2641 [Verrucomicrobiota bacterium]
MTAAPPERSISASRQFIVYGADIRVRGAICDLAEQTKRGLLRVMDQRDDWATPIVINAQYPQANLPETPRAALNFSQTGFGLKLQLDLTIASDVSRPEVRRELLRAVVLEMMYRGRPNVAAGTDYSSPPDWLLEGIVAQQSEFEPAATDLLAAPVAAQKILPLADFLTQRPELLDAPGRALYRAYSFALVELLAQSPDGPHRLAKFIADLPTASNDPLAELRKHFPELSGSDGNVEKAWTTQIARLSIPQAYQLLGAAESERLLDETLHFKTAGSEKTWQLSEFAGWEKSSNAKSVLNGLTRELSAQTMRVNPVYRPIVSEYAVITALLSAGKRKGISQRLERVSSSRKRLARQMRGIDDYMNWFEATKARALSGAFTDYMKAADASARPEPRRDPISVYLDVLEAQFQN